VELLLIRHGLPVREESGDGTPVDPRLSPEGVRQAERLAAWLEAETLEALYTSPMRRARETVEPLARLRGLDPGIEPDLVEVDHLSDAYVPLEELKRDDYPRWQALVQQGGLYAGVDLVAFRASVRGALDRIIDAHPGGRVAVTCHGGVINAWTSTLLGVDDLFVFEPGYTSVSRFVAQRGGRRSIVSLNETAHLRGPIA
jgi:probable phosphoglycerate mutase